MSSESVVILVIVTVSIRPKRMTTMSMISVFTMGTVTTFCNCNFQLTVFAFCKLDSGFSPDLLKKRYAVNNPLSTKNESTENVPFIMGCKRKKNYEKVTSISEVRLFVCFSSN